MSPPLHFVPRETFRPAYMLDALVKSGVAFHVAWPVSLFGLYCGSRWRAIPCWLIGWSIAGVLYSGAGFLHNTLAQGYPLRMTYVLAPLVYVGCLCALTQIRAKRVQTLIAIMFVCVYAIVMEYVLHTNKIIMPCIAYVLSIIH